MDTPEGLAAGHAAHDMLLWGSRGMGKSALVRAAVLAAQEAGPARIALVQVATDAVASLSALFAALAPVARNFLVFVDDLGFARAPTQTLETISGGEIVRADFFMNWAESRRAAGLE